MTLEFEQESNNLIVKLQGELDHHTAKIISDKLDKLIARGGFKNLIFECSKLEFMDSSGLGVMMGRYKKLNTMGGKAAIVNVNPSIDRVFKISGIYSIIKKYDDVSKAIEKLGEEK